MTTKHRQELLDLGCVEPGTEMAIEDIKPARMKCPTNPGPQPENQIAGTLEEQLARIGVPGVARMGDRETEYAELEVVEVKAVREKSVLLELDDGDQVWIPLSQVRDPGVLEKGIRDTVVEVAAWFARKEGLI